MKRLKTFALTLAMILSSTVIATAQEPALGIGSKAPALDIEHWIQDGNGFFKPVTKLQKDKVYVVEFWATWCPPCVASMPHLAQLQNKYRGQDVQVISVTDEPLELVNKFLPGDHPEEKKPMTEITSAYCLTSDPDGSTSASYMEAAEQNGIPCAFLVGKTGEIEWIGHPMEMDEPLEQVVAGDWDREAFKKRMVEEQKLQATVQKVMELYSGGKLKEAIKAIDTVLASDLDDEKKDAFRAFRIQLMFESGDRSDEVLTFFRKQLDSSKDDALGTIRFAMTMMNAAREGIELGPLGDDITAALAAVAPKAEKPMLPMLYNTIAQIEEVAGNTEKAIAAQKKSIESASGRQKERLQAYLDELTGADKEAEAKDDAAKEPAESK